MTLQNLKYVVAVADYNSLSAAAKGLYISQSTLSAAIHELEVELGIKLFARSNRGVTLTVEGTDFLRYAREIVEQTDRLEQRYRQRKYAPACFSVSTQRLPFAIRAFKQFVNTFDANVYDIAIRECPTYTIISDVASGKSDLGILALHDRYFSTLERIFKTNEVLFTEIDSLRTFVFLRRQHPLSHKSSVSIMELLQYPFITYDQEADRSEYTEEIIFYELSEKTIHVCDRCSKVALVRLTDGYSIGPDLTNSNADYFHNDLSEIVAIPVTEVPELLHVGYIVRRDAYLSEYSKSYLNYLKEEICSIKERFS